MTSTIYGIISDIHILPSKARIAIEYLKNQGAKKLILNGDIGEGLPTINASRTYIATILQATADSGLETYVQPGSHERLSAYLPVIKDFSNRYSNIINVLEQQLFQGANHTLLFIPGSDSLSTGEFQLGDELPTGAYILIPDQQNKQLRPVFIPNEKLDNTFLNTMHPGHITSRYYFNIHDIIGQVHNGEKTLAICHVPPRSASIRHGVDVAYFGKSQKGDIIPGVVVEQQIKKMFQSQLSRDPTKDEIKNVAKQNGITLKTDNVGNEILRDLYAHLGITRAINGHIHESGHRAHTSLNTPMAQNEWTTNLFWNSGCLDQNQCGLLEIDGTKVRYKNVNINQATGLSFNLLAFQEQKTPPSSKTITTAQSIKRRIIMPSEGIINPKHLKPKERQQLFRT